MLTKKKLQEIIKSVGIDNIRFIIPAHKLYYIPILGIGYTDSSSQEDLVEYKIKYKDEWEIYNPLSEYPYKIKLLPTEDGYGSEVYYFMDFLNLIRQGIIKIQNEV